MTTLTTMMRQQRWLAQQGFTRSAKAMQDTIDTFSQEVSDGRRPINDFNQGETT